MIDKKKLQKLAHIMVNYSIELKKGQKVLLRGFGFDSYPLIKELYRECIKAGAIDVAVRFSTDELSRIFFEEASDKQLNYMDDMEIEMAKSYDAMIQIIADQNRFELNDIDPKKLQTVRKIRKPISDILHENMWCLFYYPTSASANLAKCSTEKWEEFVLNSCLLDWKKVEEMENKFIAHMKKIDKVRIVGEETDLTLSVKGQNWRACCGKRNLPDGEIFTGPIRNSLNGVIKYNTPSHYMGQDFDWVKLWLENGKVVKEDSNNKKALTRILDTDEGARYFGEFAFGLNKNIKNPTRMIIFDEKMSKSLHMALGRCYKECSNDNDSSIHWDLIFRFKEAKAEIYFDDKKVFEKGKWIDKKLDFLN